MVGRPEVCGGKVKQIKGIKSTLTLMSTEYRIVKSYCIPETDITPYVDYILITKEN